MTGYTVHTGSTVKFSGSWDRIFSEKTAKKPAKRVSAKPVPKAGNKKAGKQTGKKAKRSKSG
jgi:hypothetical protein